MISFIHTQITLLYRVHLCSFLVGMQIIVIRAPSEAAVHVDISLFPCSWWNLLGLCRRNHKPNEHIHSTSLKKLEVEADKVVRLHQLQLTTGISMETSLPLSIHYPVCSVQTWILCGLLSRPSSVLPFMQIHKAHSHLLHH